MSVGCEEPGIWGKFQSAAGEKLQNSVRAREILRNNMVRLTLAARRLVLVMAKNSVYASYTYTYHKLQRNSGSLVNFLQYLRVNKAAG